MIQQLKDAVSSSKNPDLEFEEVNDYTTTSMGETVKGLITYLITKFIRGVFFICITTRKLVLGEKKEFVTGRTPLLKTMRAMEITEKEATKFFKLFEKIDEDHSGSIEIQEFFDFFKLEMTDFARRAFEVMDFDRAKNSVGSLHYGEFFVSMWNFCTLSHETLVKFTFDLYDTDGSGELSEKEIYNMVRMMRPSSSAKDADRETRKMMVLMDKEDAEIGVKDNMVSFDEFMSAHRKVGTVIFPAFQLQRTIRLKSMSKKFWQQATSKRERLFPTDINDVGTTDLIELYKNFCEEKEEPPEKVRACRLQRERERERERETDRVTTCTTFTSLHILTLITKIHLFSPLPDRTKNKTNLIWPHKGIKTKRLSYSWTWKRRRKK